jgi:hypothetical protein
METSSQRYTLMIVDVLFVMVGSCGGYTPGNTRWYMGRTIRGGPARKIKAYASRLQVVLDIVIIPNWIVYL